VSDDGNGNRLFAICTQEGQLLHSIVFAHAPTAKAYFEGGAEEYWEKMVEEEGLHPAAVPTIEWLEIEPPGWADSGAPAWAGYTDDGVNPVIVAGITVEHRALAA